MGGIAPGLIQERHGLVEAVGTAWTAILRHLPLWVLAVADRGVPHLAKCRVDGAQRGALAEVPTLRRFDAATQSASLLA